MSRNNSGQAMVEYVILAGMLVLMLSILYLFHSTFGDYGTRIIDFVASEYP